MKTKIQSFLAALFLFSGAVSAQYCAPTFNTGCTFGDQIENFYTTGGASNITNMASGCSAGSYNYFSSMSCAQLQGQDITLNMQSGTQYAQGFKVWIDWNNNNSFADAGDLVYTSPGSATTLYSGNVTVPITATPGTKRMRVVCNWIAVPVTNDGCPLGQTYGECEDYDFIVVATSSCTGTPNAGTAITSASPICPSINYTLSLTGATLASGLSYQWQSATSATGPFANIPNATAPNYTTSQTVDTWYQCIVTCSGQSATSSIVAVATNPFFNCYCNSIASQPTEDEEIYNVTVNGASTDPLYATTNACTNIAPGPGSVLGGYSNFKSLPALTTVTTGQTVAFSVVQDECNGAPYFANGIGVWIDFNHNGLFTDAGEAVFIEQATVVGPRTLNGSFMIPMTATTGNTAMRIICAENASATSWLLLEPCMLYTYGETEDYLINIIAAAPCAGTPNAGATLASLTTACPTTPIDLSLDNATVATGISYQWVSAPAANGPWTPIAGANNAVFNTTVAADTYFACVLTCAASAASDTSTAVQVLSTPYDQCYCNTVNAGGAGTLMNDVAFSFGGANIWNNNTSAVQPTASPYYSSFTSGPSVIQGMDYGVGVTIQAPGLYTGAIVSVWIDYNQNGSYEPTEWTQVGTNIAGNTTGTVNITIPMSALPGNTGMRVRSRGGLNQNGAGDACTNMGSGETEDYVINILPAPDCANPTNLIATSAVDSIMTSWNWSQTLLPVTGFNYQLVEAGMPFSTGTTYVIDANTSDTLFDPSFIAGQSFEVYLQAVCGQDTSYFVGPFPVMLPMTNDMMCNAAAIPVDGHAYIFNNTGATVDPSEVSVVPPATGAQTTTGWANTNLNLTTWFTFTAPPSGNVRINSTAMNYNGQIAVYEGTDCAVTASFTMMAANDDDLDGANTAPNFTICGLTPGDTYYLLNDGFNNIAGNYAISISEIDLNAGVEGEVIEVCYGDTVNLFNGIANYQTGGEWSQTIPTLGLQGSSFVTTGLATVMFEFTYELVDGCASDDVQAYVDVFPASSAGVNGTFTVCKNEPFNLLSGLSGTVDMGGYWLDPSNNPISGNIDTASNIPGNFNYDYIVTNGVCPADTSTVLVVVDGSCDFTAGLESVSGKFVVYPNPSADMINIENGLDFELDQIAIIDMSGRVVFVANKGTFNNELAQVDLTHLTTGVYTLQLSAGEQVFTSRIIKQ
jgi:hypothetical protein